MGASQFDLFWKIVLPGTLPSIFTGAAVGMGITLEVVLAAEMISGGGTQGGRRPRVFYLEPHMGGSLEQTVLEQISIGIADICHPVQLEAWLPYDAHVARFRMTTKSEN